MSDSYANIRDRGTEVLNTCAFLNQRDETMISPDSANTYEKITYQDAYSALYNANKDNMVFTQKILQYKIVGVTQTGYKKLVRSDSAVSYRESGRAVVGDSYKYWISYTTLGETVARDIVIYDELEAMKGSEWQGVLTGVDVGALMGKLSYVPGADKDT